MMNDLFENVIIEYIHKNQQFKLTVGQKNSFESLKICIKNSLKIAHLTNRLIFEPLNLSMQLKFILRFYGFVI